MHSLRNRISYIVLNDHNKRMYRSLIWTRLLQYCVKKCLCSAVDTFAWWTTKWQILSSFENTSNANGSVLVGHKSSHLWGFTVCLISSIPILETIQIVALVQKRFHWDNSLWLSNIYYTRKYSVHNLFMRVLNSASLILVRTWRSFYLTNYGS